MKFNNEKQISKVHMWLINTYYCLWTTSEDSMFIYSCDIHSRIDVITYIFIIVSDDGLKIFKLFVMETT